MKSKGRPKGSKQIISNENIIRANNIRNYITENNINVTNLRTKLGIKNSCLYYFMQNKTQLESWLKEIEFILGLNN